MGDRRKLTQRCSGGNLLGDKMRKEGFSRLYIYDKQGMWTATVEVEEEKSPGQGGKVGETFI